MNVPEPPQVRHRGGRERYPTGRENSRCSGSNRARPSGRCARHRVRHRATCSVSYGSATASAVKGVSLEIYRNTITALIGPSGCGKSTFLRCLNRMNDLVSNARVDGKLLYYGNDLYGPGVDPIEVRRRIGMVFQRPNPFPKSIYDNIAWGPAHPRHEGQPRRPRRARR